MAGSKSTPFSVYDTTTGNIRLAGVAQEAVLPSFAQAGEAIVEKWLDGTTVFVDVNAVPVRAKPRPVIAPFDKIAIKADGVDAATLELAEDMRVSVDGIVSTVAKGPLAFKADSPGAYVITIRQFPYQDFAATVTAA